MLYLTRLAPALGRRKVLRRIVYLLVVSAVWAAILTPTYLVYRGEISDSNVLPSSPIPNFSQYINVSARISNIDTLKGSYHLTLDLLAVFDGPANANSLPLFTRANGERRANLPITLTIQDTTKAIRVGERLGSIDATITFDESDTRDYPFDQHLSNVDLIAQTTFNNVTRSVPMRISVNGAVPGFALPQFGVFADQSQDFGSLLLTLTIGRSGTTKGFALFIVALSWFLSLIMGYLALQVARKKRAVEPPMMAPPCALLFALPSLRNVQPGVPGIGASVDVLGFFWNMAIVAISAVVIILYFILRWKPPVPEGQLPASTSATEAQSQPLVTQLGAGAMIPTAFSSYTMQKRPSDPRVGAVAVPY